MLSYVVDSHYYPITNGSLINGLLINLINHTKHGPKIFIFILLNV